MKVFVFTKQQCEDLIASVYEAMKNADNMGDDYSRGYADRLEVLFEKLRDDDYRMNGEEINALSERIERDCM